jgi:methyl-accepting chemotaxis protein
MNLKTKFIIIGLAAAFTVLVLVGQSVLVNKERLKAFNIMQMISTITQRHMEGDMMHDAIRADVFAALLAFEKNDPEAIAKAASDLEEHYNNFKENLAKNDSQELPADIKAFFGQTFKDLEAYHSSASEVINSPSKEAAANANVDFIEKFEILEEKLSNISDKIDAWGEQEASKASIIADKSQMEVMVLSSIAILLSLFVPLYATISIFNPQSRLIIAMNQLASGDLETEIIGTGRKDEIGEIAKSLEIFKIAASDKDRMEKEQKFAEVRAKEEKKQAMHDLARKFQERVQGMINSVAAAATELSQTSESMKSNIDDVSVKAMEASAYSIKTAENVNTVASASEEMSASVREVSNQVTKSTQAVNEAVLKAENASGSAKSLEEATIKIGDIVGLIRDIAEQINLLALNATIESARAGEAGKGFAVVASEVKNLASQTTNATDDIAFQIEAVQGVSTEVVEALNAIKKSVDKVNEFSSGIVSAVEEQSSTTSEIAKNMQIAAQGTREISDNVENITESTVQAKESSAQMLDASKMLSREAEQLSAAVETFLNEVRNG